MKKRYHLDELESFIAESADEVRMYPSDRVWLHIDKRLRGERKWPALTFGAILTGALLLASLIFLQPDKDLFEIKPLAASARTETAGSIHTVSPAHKHTAHLVSPSSKVGKVTNPAVARHFNESMVREEMAASHTASNAILPAAGAVSEEDMTAAEALTAYPSETGSDGSRASWTVDNEALTAMPALSQIHPVAGAAYHPQLEAAAQAPSSPQAGPLFVSGQPADQVPEAVAATTAAPSLTSGKTRASRWNVQYYGAPSISYRILTEEKNFNKELFSNGQIPAAYYNDVTRVVHHREGLGLEAGASFGYKATDKLTLTVGLQLNYRQYTIEAFEGTARASVLRLQTRTGIDTLMAVSHVVNYSSNRPMEVQNHYLQVSLPVGFELAVASFGKSAFVLAANIQPTYNLYQNAWLISSDYQRYVQEPTLMRGWNVNSGVGAYFRFATKGGLQWQAGPQIRYQLLSSFTEAYQVRENLIDYGFRIGVSKTLQ